MSAPRPSAADWPRWQRQALTLVISAAGGALLYALGAPLPLLFGAIGASLIAALFGLPLTGVPLASTVSRTLLGVAVGCSITPALVASLPGMVPTLLLIPVYVLVIALIGRWWFSRICGYDRHTAWYAAMPGGLQDMLQFGIEAGGDGRALSLIHATRLLVLVSAAPWVLVLGLNQSLDQPLGPPAQSLGWSVLALQFAVGILGWKLFARIGLFGASVLGPMLLAAPLSLAGVLESRPPQEAILISQFFIGVGVGVHYRGITRAELRHDVLSALGFAVVLAAVAGLTMLVAARLDDSASTAEHFLAFWPAGQAELAVLGLAAGANLGFIVAHHLLRIVLVILGAPLAGRLSGRQ